MSAAEQVGCLGALAGVVSRKEAALARTSVDYFAVLLAERNAHLESLRRELEQLEATRRHAELHGRLRLFSECAQLETVGSLQVTFLDRGGDQYQRCKKAVKDNTAPNIFDNPFFEGIKVLHVVSVKHSLLLDRIQVSSRPMWLVVCGQTLSLARQYNNFCECYCVWSRIGSLDSSGPGRED